MWNYSCALSIALTAFLDDRLIQCRPHEGRDFAPEMRQMCATEAIAHSTALPVMVTAARSSTRTAKRCGDSRQERS
jgi:hypothetical protein